MCNDNSDKAREKKKSFADKAREIDAAERKAELDAEAKAAAERAKREDEQRRLYEEKLRREKLELIKLKQGVISENDIEKAAPVPEKKYTIAEKISNFFYHYKFHVIVGGLFAALAIFLIYDYCSTVRPDVQAMYIATDYDMNYYTDAAGELLSPYTSDYNGDGDAVVKVYYVPTGYADDSSASMYLAQSDRTKLLGEFQSGTTILIIGTKESYESLGAMEGVFADCRELFPDDPYAEEIGYRIAGTDFMTLIGREDMDDTELYASFRAPTKTMGLSEEKMADNYEKAVDMWRKFLSEHRIDGLELPDVPDPEPLPDIYDDYYETYTEDQSQ